MRVLAVETATPLGSVSLVDEDGVILERESGAVSTHSTWLLPAIREVPPPQTLLGGVFVLAGIALGTMWTSPPDSGTDP